MEERQPVSLGGRAFDILTALVSRAGTVVSPEELLAHAWPGVFVENGALRVHIAALRRALGDGQTGRRFIINTPGRGYSFVASVTQLPMDGEILAFEVPTAPTDNLPALPARMLRRERAVSALVSQLPKHRFMTIVGPGGIGKTTVALAAAAALRVTYKDGVRFVDLASIADPALVSSALASTLGLSVSSSDPIPALVAVLQQKAMLVVLDNCEHVITAAATLAEAIYKGAPDVHVLATSREALRARGEYIQRLRPLEAPPALSEPTAAQALTFPAVQLFVQRAAAVLDSFALSDANAPVIAEICRRLDGIALAIELAAGRVDTFGVRGVAARLDDRFQLLTHGHRTAMPRHQTLTATFDWSFKTLAEPARTVLRRVSVLVGDFTMEEAVGIAADDLIPASVVAEQVANLVSVSFVAVNIASENVFFRLLESTRAYAIERLLESGEQVEISRRHAQNLLKVFEQANIQSSTWLSADWLVAYGRQLDNVRAALDWAFSSAGDRGLGVALTIAAVPLWLHLSLNKEYLSRVVAALLVLPAIEGQSCRLRMQLLAALGMALQYTRDSRLSSEQAWQDTIEIAENLQDVEYQLRGLRGLWSATYNAGDIETAISYSNRFSRVTAQSARAEDVPVLDRMMGLNCFYQGELKDARVHLERAFNAHCSVGSGLDIVRFQFDQRVISSVPLSMILWLQGLPDQAMRMAERSIEYAREVKHELSVTFAISYAACRIAHRTGDLESTERYVGMLSQQASVDPTSHWNLLSQCWQGARFNRQGESSAAAVVLEQAVEKIPEGSFSLHHMPFLGELACALARSGEVGRASETLTKALDLCDRRNERWFFAELLRLKGEIALLAGSANAVSQAADNFRQAIDLARQQGALSWELRAATSLAQLKANNGRRREASDLLSGVYSRFTEGFATSDMKAARLVLESLN